MCWIYVMISFALVCIVGLMSGLTLGLMSLSALDLEVLAKSGQPNYRVNPENILPLVRNKHLLLSTFAIYNSLAAEALSIFIDALIPTWASILISATLLLAFGEISYHAGSRAGGGSRGGGRLGGSSTPRPEVEHVVEHHEAEDVVVEEEVESSPGKKELDPNGLWFNDSAVSRTITNAFKKYFHQPWRDYSMVDQATKDHWFKLFKDTYKWRSELDPEVRRGFDQTAEIRLKGLYQYVTKKKMGVCPLWMPNLVHKAMMKNVKDDTFKLKSQKSIKNNRRVGDLDNLVQPSHCQGSISAAERAKRLASKSGRVLPTNAELHLDTYMREEPEKGKVPVSDRVKRIKETYEKNRADYKERDVKKTPKQISYDTVSGRKRGKVACCTPSIIDQLSARLEESERARAEDARKNDENAKKNVEEILEMKKTLDMYAQMFNKCKDFDFSHHFLPHPDDKSGSGRACAN